MAHDGKSARNALNTEAAQWVVRLASENCTAADREAFEAWRCQSVSHEIAFERETLTWERTERLRALRPPVHPEQVADADGSPVASRWGRWTRSPEGSPRRWPVATLAASILAAVGIAVFVWINSATTAYATAVGERRIIHLEDGSRLELNTNTKVAVRMSEGARHIELLRGESLFDVFPDKTRPFTVVMGNNSVRAVGTAFNIRRDDVSYKVLVTEGVVEVSGKATGSLPAYQVRLPAGSIGTYDAHGMASHMVSAAEQERALSWRSGTIALAGETLVEATAEFNRYNLKQIIVADPAIEGLQLGGYFNAHDLDGFVKVLTAAFALQVETSGNEISLKGTARTAALPAEL